MSSYLVASHGTSTAAPVPGGHLPTARRRVRPSDTSDTEWSSSSTRRRASRPAELRRWSPRARSRRSRRRRSIASVARGRWAQRGVASVGTNAGPWPAVVAASIGSSVRWTTRSASGHEASIPGHPVLPSRCVHRDAVPHDSSRRQKRQLGEPAAMRLGAQRLDG